MTDKLKPNDEIPPELMRKFGDLLSPMLQGRGFCLIVSTTMENGTDSKVQYISNVKRPAMQSYLEFFLNKWRKGN